MAVHAVLKSELIDVLKGQPDHKVILDIVRAFKLNGGVQQTAYDTLQDIWTNYGFDNKDGEDENTLRNELEYAMEIVWGFCGKGLGIWETSLSIKCQ